MIKEMIMSKNIIIIISIGLIILVFNYSSYIKNEPTQNITPIKTNITKDINNNETDNDKDFKNWMALSYTPIYDDVNCITKAAKDKSFSDIELCGKLLKDDSNRSLKQIGSYNISLSLIPLFNQYKKSLQYYNLGGENLEIGARNRDAQKMGISSEYIRQANEIMKNISMN